MFGVKSSYAPLVVGSLVDKVTKSRMAGCSFAKSVGFRCGVPCYLCSLGSGSACLYNGRHVRWKAHFSGFEVVWVCPKLVGLPNEEM
jgi:hypothetical protein